VSACSNLGAAPAYSKILDAATAGLANKPAKETTLAYRDALSSLWLLDAIPSKRRRRRRPAGAVPPVTTPGDRAEDFFGGIFGA
jgi:hypothetical protein